MEVKFVSDLCLIIFLRLSVGCLVFVLMFYTHFIFDFITNSTYLMCVCVFAFALVRHQMYFHFDVHVKCVFFESFISSTEKMMCIFRLYENQVTLELVLCISSSFFLPSFHPFFLIVFIRCFERLSFSMRVAHVRNR